MSVRVGRREDAAAIAECLAPLGYGTTAAWVSQSIATSSGSQGDALFVCEMGEAGLVGVISAHVIPLLHTPGALTRITALSIREGYSRRGIGRILIEQVEAWSRELGACRIEVTSGDHRHGAHAFYQAVGYALQSKRLLKTLASP
jgi:GNAT superfamily N-acetyltransferase